MPRTPKPSPARILAFACLSALVLSIAAGCKKEAEKATVLAQVGGSSLTLEDLRESFPAEFEQLIRREQYLDFIKRWMDDEVIYQQAVKSQIDADPLIKRKLDKLRRKVLIEEFLARENASEVFEPDEIAMNQYYEMHKEDFRRKVPEVKFAQIRTQTGKQAADLRYKANRGDFLEVAAAGSLDPVPESYASIAFKKLSETPPCLTRQIAEADIGAVPPPIACPDGFYVIKVMERQDAGSLIPFTEAKEEISGILVMDRKDKLLENRIDAYKENLSVSYNLDQIPGLSESHKAASPAEASVAGPVSDTVAETPPSRPPAAPASPKPPAEPVPAANAAAPAPAPAVDRMPREPAHSQAETGIPKEAAQTAAPVAAPAAVDPRLPREPWQEPPDAAGKPKPPAKKRSGTGGDSNSIKPGAAATWEELNQQNPGAKPSEQEIINAQTEFE